MPTILEKLKAMGVKNITLSDEEEPIKRYSKAPRDKLASHIQDSINLLQDPTYTVKTLKGNVKTPVPFYRVKDGNAKIRLKYFRTTINVDNNSVSKVPESELLLTLKGLMQCAKDGDFDKQLEPIKAARSKVMKKKK